MDQLQNQRAIQTHQKRDNRDKFGIRVKGGFPLANYNQIVSLLLSLATLVPEIQYQISCKDAVIGQDHISSIKTGSEGTSYPLWLFPLGMPSKRTICKRWAGSNRSKHKLYLRHWRKWKMIRRGMTFWNRTIKLFLFIYWSEEGWIRYWQYTWKNARI